MRVTFVGLAQKLGYHIERVKRSLIDPLNTPPITLDVDPTTRCNSRCPNCTFPGLASTDLEFGLFKRVISEAKDFGVKAVTYTGGGEPTLHPHFPEMVKYTREAGLDVGLITNGLNLDFQLASDILPHLNWIRFSLDAGTSEVYQRSHGLVYKWFNRLGNNILQTAMARKETSRRVVIGATYLVEKCTPGDFAEAFYLCRGLGIDFLNFKPMQIPDVDMVGGWGYYREALMQSKEEIERLNYDRAFSVFISRFCPYIINGDENYRRSPVCYGQRLTTSVGADGKLYACCHYKYDPRFEIGDLKTYSLQVLWKSERRQELLDLDPRSNCLLGCKLEDGNEMIHEEKIANQGEVVLDENGAQYINFI